MGVRPNLSFGYNPFFPGKSDSSTSGQTTAISAMPPCGPVTVPQGLHSKCSPTILPWQIERPYRVFVCVFNHARAGMYLALTVSVSLSVLMFRGVHACSKVEEAYPGHCQIQTRCQNRCCEKSRRACRQAQGHPTGDCKSFRQKARPRSGQGQGACQSCCQTGRKTGSQSNSQQGQGNGYPGDSCQARQESCLRARQEN